MNLLVAAVAISASVSCEREYDTPPERFIPEGNIITLAELRNNFTLPHKFTGDTSIYAVVTTDEVNGNFFKDVYVQDATGAMLLRLTSSGGLYKGDSVRIYLKGTILQDYNGMMQLDSVDVDENIVKQATGKVIQPENVTITDLGPLYHAKLVRLQGVQFASTDTALTWADAVNLSSVNRELLDCGGNTVIVRSSGYANFAGSSLPNGNGDLIGVVGQFGSDIQLFIRDPQELTMNNVSARCQEPYLSKTFEDDNVLSGGWIIRNVIGSINWETNSQGSIFGSYYGMCSNYDAGSGNSECESWLISPSVDLSNASIPFLEFQNACNYNGSQMEVYISNNYDGVSSPTTATWTQLSPVLSSGSFAWVSSGILDITGFKTSGVYIGFKYTGSSTSGKTWEIDNVIIDEL